jgi:predicted DNA-binding protein
MEQTPFELTPEQKGMLASLSRETGKPLPALLAAIAAALEELEETSNGHEAVEPAVAAAPQLFWQKAIEASQRIPEEDLERLPADLAAQVDHYIYGTPKR